MGRITEAKMLKTDRKVYDRNPFLDADGRVGSQIVMSKKDYFKSDHIGFVRNGGELIDGDEAGFWQGREVDSMQFVRLFANGIKALQGLTSAGTKVFEVLYRKLLGKDMVDKDRVFLSFMELDQAYTPMSKATYTRGLKELILKGFIAPTPIVNWFWLNPAYMWNGKRLLFVQDYRLNEGLKLSGFGEKTAVLNRQQLLAFEELRLPKEELHRRLDDLDAGRGVKHDMIEVD